MRWLRRLRWPWRPREYVAVLAALDEAERALARRRTEAARQRHVQASVRHELQERRRDHT